MNKKVDEALVSSVMKRLEKKKINVATASLLLGVTERQIYKIKKRVKSPPTNVEKKPRKSLSNKTDDETKQKVIELYKNLNILINN